MNNLSGDIAVDMEKEKNVANEILSKSLRYFAVFLIFSNILFSFISIIYYERAITNIDIASEIIILAFYVIISYLILKKYRNAYIIFLYFAIFFDIVLGGGLFL